MKLSDLKHYNIVAGTGTGIPEPQTQQKKTFGQKILNTASDISNFIGAKGITDEYGATIARAKAGTQQEKNNVEFPTNKEVIGSAIQTGANLIPGVGPELGLLGKTAVGLGTGYAFDVGSNLQNKDKSIGESFTPGVGTVVGGTLPIAGSALNVVRGVVGRVLKGVGSGLSGVSSDTIQKIVDNPKIATRVSQQLEKTGNAKVLEDNVKTILNGVGKIKQEARSAFGKGLEDLKTTDINPATFREQTQNFLERHGIYSENGKRILSGVEFNDPKNIDKASSFIDRLSNAELDGASLRKLSDDIDSAKYKVATSDERLSYNAFLKDLSQSIKNAVTKSTDKLGEINKNFSQDMQLANGVEQIFGKVNYKNLPEVIKASQKLETLFSQKGLAPDVVDKFMERIGINPQAFRTSEAVRQIGNKADTANSVGLNVSEVLRGVTSAVVTPKMVKQIAIKTGLAEDAIVPFLKKISPLLRKALINELVNQENNQSQK